MKPSTAQRDALLRMALSGRPLIRRAGGFWTLDTTPLDDATGYPSWSVPWQTVRAMESRGWLARANRYGESWRDDRLLTDAGRAAMEGA